MIEMPSERWRAFFQGWPAEMPRRGILVTTFDEQIPFSGFLTREDFLVLERQTPDSLGARTIVLAYDVVAGLKITEVVRAKTFQAVGFQGAFSKR